ncbi:hypothetical protein ABIG06_001575 [Bradyrhizobium sp. USDA 326]|uniref:hypothetical protein n=1 Tax=unclassified Bradyrhizobium TaxID=2631580 RepID=UPI003515839E
MVYKKLINQSGVTLTVLLITLVGSEPNQSGPTVTAALPVGDKQTIEYGNAQNPFLNGLVISSSSGAFSTGSQIVTTRGSSWDTVLNTHDTLTVSGAGGLNLVGSNT